MENRHTQLAHYHPLYILYKKYATWHQYKWNVTMSMVIIHVPKKGNRSLFYRSGRNQVPFQNQRYRSNKRTTRRNQLTSVIPWLVSWAKDAHELLFIFWGLIFTKLVTSHRQSNFTTITMPCAAAQKSQNGTYILLFYTTTQ